LVMKFSFFFLWLPPSLSSYPSILPFIHTRYRWQRRRR
jgi:hypothetical protein